MSKILVIIPAWNEEDALPSVLDTVLTYRDKLDVLVVDDGSTDSTAELVSKRKDVQLLSLPVNMGVGAAMRLGYLYAKRNNYEYAVQLDADGQHIPAYIFKLVACMNEEDADLVIGSRFANVGSYQASGPRWWAMRVLSVIFSKIFDTEITDVTSGFKLVNRKAIDLLSSMLPAEYLGDTIGALGIIYKNHLKVRQTGVEMQPRQGGVASHSPAKAALFLGRAMFSLIFILLRKTNLEKK